VPWNSRVVALPNLVLNAFVEAQVLFRDLFNKKLLFI